MALDGDAQKAMQEFDSMRSDAILEILGRIQAELQSNLTRDYLAGKILAVRNTDAEPERKEMCKALLPYLDWYLQGS